MTVLDLHPIRQGQLDSVSAAALQSDQGLEDARAALAVAEQRLAEATGPREEAPQPTDGSDGLQRQEAEAAAELERLRGENAVLEQLLQEAQARGAALRPESEDWTANPASEFDEATLELEPPPAHPPAAALAPDAVDWEPEPPRIASQVPTDPPQESEPGLEPDRRDQTPTVPPGGSKRKRQDTVPANRPDTGGAYSFVAPRSPRKKPRR